MSCAKIKEDELEEIKQMLIAAFAKKKSQEQSYVANANAAIDETILSIRKKAIGESISAEIAVKLMEYLKDWRGYLISTFKFEQKQAV